MNYRVNEFSGPNLHNPNAGMLITFKPKYAYEIDAGQVNRVWNSFRNDETILWPEPGRQISFPELVGSLVAAFHPLDAFASGEAVAHGYDAGREEAWVFVRSLDNSAAALASKMALEISDLIFEIIGEGRTDLSLPRASRIDALLQRVTRRLPPKSTQLLMRSADIRGIPYYRISASNDLWQFGQGAEGVHLAHNSGEDDSYTGTMISSDKFLCNNFVCRLGFPGVTHATVNSAEQAVQAADSIGYPIVIKPVASGMGVGITAAITDPSEIGQAYTVAERHSRYGVLVERYVEGVDHRIAIFGGKIAWVGAKYPARVVGDGMLSIAGLIEQENQRRSGDPYRKPIVRDDAMDKFLAKQGLNYEHCPAEGVEIRLRTVANVAMGGTWIELDDIHPENVEMAESLAKALRMANIGIDFITSDIRRSWRETSCAIIEVNQTPGFYKFSEAQRVLQNTIPEDSVARIPTLLMIDCAGEAVDLAEKALASAGLSVGVATSGKTRLGDRQKGKETDGLHARVDSLIADPQCEALVVSATREDIRRRGLPLDKFDLAVFSTALDPDLVALCGRHCEESQKSYQSDSSLERDLHDWLGRMGGKSIQSVRLKNEP